MSRYLLDTNAVSALLKGNHPALTLRSAMIPVGSQFIPSIVRAELFFGWSDAPQFASRISDLETFFAAFPTLEFNDDAAREYGKLRSLLKRSGLMIGPNDLLIASIALAHSLILVAHNTSEFARVPNLQLEDWQ